jgi:hypothetical protein
MRCYSAFEKRQLVGDIEGTLGSGLASSKQEGVAFDPNEIEERRGVPIRRPKSTNESADVDNVAESGGGAEAGAPEKK